jgi:copper transporter 1
MMGMQMMAMTFFTSTNSPLYSISWMPESKKSYAGTCIFLIVLAAILRGLLAIRLNIFRVLRKTKHAGKEDLVHEYDYGRGAAIRPWKANEAVYVSIPIQSFDPDTLDL